MTTTGCSGVLAGGPDAYRRCPIIRPRRLDDISRAQRPCGKVSVQGNPPPGGAESTRRRPIPSYPFVSIRGRNAFLSEALTKRGQVPSRFADFRGFRRWPRAGPRLVRAFRTSVEVGKHEMGSRLFPGWCARKSCHTVPVGELPSLPAWRYNQGGSKKVSALFSPPRTTSMPLGGLRGFPSGCLARCRRRIAARVSAMFESQSERYRSVKHATRARGSLVRLQPFGEFPGLFSAGCHAR
jgi:hypothetical protein